MFTMHGIIPEPLFRQQMAGVFPAHKLMARVRWLHSLMKTQCYFVFTTGLI